MSKRLISAVLAFALMISMLYINGAFLLNAFAGSKEESVPIVNGSFEDGLPGFIAGAGNSSLVSTSADGSKALKVVNSSVFRANVDTDALKTVDVSRSYKLQFSAKADGSFNGKIYINAVSAKTGSAVSVFPYKLSYRTEFFAVGSNGNADLSTDWNTYTTENLSVCGTEYYFDFNVSGNGTVIIDDLKLVPADEANAGGSVTYSYDESAGKSVLTAHPNDGYKVSKILVTLGNGWDAKTIDAEYLCEDTENNTVSYIYDHDSHIYGSNDGKSFVTAVFDEIPNISIDGVIKLENGGFENGSVPGNWGGAISLVDDAYEGNNALKLESNGIVFFMDMNPADLKNIDINRRYFLRFKAKATSDYKGTVRTRLTTTSGDVTDNVFSALWADTYDSFVNSSLTTDWETYTTTDSFVLCGVNASFGFYTEVFSGSVIIDNVEIVPAEESDPHGTVTYSFDSESGTRTITAHPMTGYKVESISLKDRFDADIPLTKVGEADEDNAETYTFEHKSYHIRSNIKENTRFVTVSFVEIASENTVSGGIVNGGFESGKPTFIAGNADDAVLVNDAMEGNKALKLKAGQIIRLSVDSEALKAFDVSRAYTLKFYAKAADSFNGKLYMKQVQVKVGDQTVPQWPFKWAYGDEFYAISRGESHTLPSEWNEYSTEQFSVCGTEFSFNLNIDGTGYVIIDDLRIVPIDEENEGGTVTYSYNSELGKSVLTAHANQGYKPSKMTVTLASGWDSRTFDAELSSEDTENNTAQFTYNHDSAFFGNNGGNAFVTAEFEIADTSDFVYSGNVANGGFEKKPWSITNQKDQIVSIDTENTFNNSLGALKVEMSNFYQYPNGINFNSYSLPEVAQNLDTSKKYCVALWLKTSDDFDGSVYVRVAQNGAYKWYNWQTELHFIGGNNEGESGYKDWTHLYCPAFEVTNDDISLTLITDGVGTVWIDDVEIVEDPQTNNYIANGGFEQGSWSTWGSEGDGSTKSTTVVKDVTNGSAKAGKMTSASDGDFFIVQGNKMDINVNEVYRFSIDLKTEDVAMDGVTVRILQWYEDENGETATSWLRLYGSEEFIKAGGTTDWTTYSINAKGFAKKLKNITLYIYLKGKGTVWIDNVSMTVKEKAEVEAGNVGADIEPGEVNPLDVVHLYTSDEDTDIYYTVDGSDPRTSQTALLQDDAVGIIITEDTLVRAYAVGEETQSEVFDFNYKCSGALFEDDKMWAHTSSSPQAALDTSVYKVGNNSLLLEGNGSKAYACTGAIAIDPMFDYKVEFWAKIDGMEQENSSNINLFLIGGAGADQAPCGDKGAYFGNKDKLLTLKSGDDWKHYEFVIDSIDGFYSGLSLIASIDYDFGNLWIDGIKVTAIQKQNWALTVSGDGNVWGNNYYESLVSNFEIVQGFLISSSANVMENGTLAYRVYNDDDPDEILVEGDTEINVMPHATTTSSINLSAVAKYGTFTVEFSMTNARGLTYPAGSIRLARLRNDSDINKDSMFGVCVNYEQMDYDTLAKTGVSVVRFDLDWEDVEISEGNYRIKQSVIDAVNRGNELGIDTMIIFNSHHWPSWYSYEGSSGFPKTNAQIEMFMGYVRYVVEYFGDKVKYYELFNETNYMTYSAVDGAGYTKLLKRVYTAIKEISPNSKVIGGVMASIGPGQGVDLAYGEAIIDAGAADYMDYMSFHPYIQPYSPESVNWAGQIQQMQDMIQRKTGKEIPFIFTEIGWSAYYGNTGVTEEQKMNYFVRSYAWADSLGYVDRIVIYREGSNDFKYNLESKWGVFRSVTAASGTANPLGAAMANFVYMKNQFDFSEEVKLADHLYAFKYTGNANQPQKDMYMLWTDDIEALGEITTSDKSAKLYDVYGNVLSIFYEGNTFNADLSGRPVYITLDKGSVITGIKLVNSGGNISEDNKTDANGSGANHIGGKNEADDDTETAQVKKVVKTVKKVVKKGKSSDQFNWIPIIIVAASVAVAAGVTVFFIVFIKKRKKKLSV